MSYLISHMFICLLVAFLLGLFLGWLFCKMLGSCKCKTCCNKDVDSDLGATPAPIVAAPVVVDLDTSVNLDGDGYAVETLEGIGPQTGDLFRGYGIATVGDYLRKLHTPDARQTAAQDLNIKVQPIHEWASMSDLLRVQGIDHQNSELAYRAGILNVGQLANSDAASLVAQMESANNAGKQLIAPSVPSVSDVDGWISRARSMSSVVTL